MKTAMRTDIGHIRTVNEDRVVVKTLANGLTLAIVADGMGGHQAGDIASQNAVEAIDEHLDEALQQGELELETLMKEAIFRANERVFAVASSQAHYHGMGTTVVVTLVDRNRMTIGHIGDSRAYLWNGEQLIQLTEDHSLVNELLKNGQITTEEAERHPRRNVLTRALGTEPFVEVDVSTHTWRTNNILLLCTDGLSNMIDKGQMEQMLMSEKSLEEKVETLVDHALGAGGDDNISVVLLANDEEEG